MSRNQRIRDLMDTGIGVRDYRDRHRNVPLRDLDDSPKYYENNDSPTLKESFDYEERMAWLFVVILAVIIYLAFK